MKLTVIILNYKVRPFLELCLHSVERAINGLDAEIIVVDNDSADDSCEMVRAKFPAVRLVENEENFGFAKGNNIGVSHARGEYICILNPDTVVPESLFTELLAFAENKEKLGAVGCRIIDGSGRFLPESKRNLPTVKVALGKLTGSGSGYYANHIEETETSPVDILVGAVMLMKTSLYREVGGFDEQYFMYGEDVDLSYTLLKHGYENWYLGSGRLLHFKGESTLKNLDYLRRFYGSMHIFYRKHFRPNIFFNVLGKLGLMFMSAFRRRGDTELPEPTSGIYIGKQIPDGLSIARKIDYILKNELPEQIEGKEVVFDASNLDFEAILTMMETGRDSKGVRYMIRPPGADFILGSPDSGSQGKVIFWG